MKVVGKVVLGTVGGLFALGAAGAAGAAMTAGSTSVHAAVKPATKPAVKRSATTHSSAADVTAGTQGDADTGQALIDCMRGTGNAYAVRDMHITGPAIMLTASVYTDLRGGLAGPDQGKGQLVVGAFQHCVTPDLGSGLVTVYGAGGDILANGSF